MKIKFFNAKEEELPVIEAWVKRTAIEVDTTPETLTIEQAEQLDSYDGVVVGLNDTLNEHVYSILKEKRIRALSQRTAGYDYFDLEKATKNDIVISNVPSYSPESIAEFTIERVLYLLRHIPEFEARVAHKNFTWDTSVRARLLGEQTVAIIGLGNIGSVVARFFHAFGCRVVGYDIVRKPELTDIVDYKTSLEEAVKEADIITVHTPLTSDTHHMFNREIFNTVKPGTLFINVARGGVVNTEDLIQAIDAKQIGAAALDVYEGEGAIVPLDLRDKEILDTTFLKIMGNPRIFYTPHIAYYTDTSIRNMIMFSLDRTVEVIQTGTSKTRVN